MTIVVSVTRCHVVDFFIFIFLFTWLCRVLVGPQDVGSLFPSRGEPVSPALEDRQRGGCLVVQWLRLHFSLKAGQKSGQEPDVSPRR